MNTEPEKFEDDENHTPETGMQEAPDATPGPDAGIDFPIIIEKLRAELNDTKDNMMRALAEAENTRKRAKVDREDAAKFAVSGFAKDLLSVADNLRRALGAVPDDLKNDARAKALVEGIEATEREMLRTFEKNGIQKLSPAGEPFNPHFHEVMFEAPGTGKPAGTVIEVLEVGYVLNGRLLRPARVGVAKDEGQGGGTPGAQIDTQA